MSQGLEITLTVYVDEDENVATSRVRSEIGFYLLKLSGWILKAPCYYNVAKVEEEELN